MFCEFCGKQIEEGQVCDCQQSMAATQADMNQAQDNSAANQFAEQAGQAMNQLVEGTKGLLSRLVPIFKNPVDEITNLVETNNTSMAIQMIIVHTVLNTLVSIITLIKTRVSLGEYAKYADIPYVKTILIALVGTILADAAIAALLHVGTNIIYKAERTFGNMLILTGCMVMPLAFATFVGTVLGLLYAPLGALVISLGTVLGLIFMVFGYIKVVDLPDNKKLYALFVSASIILVSSAVLGIIAGQSLLNSIF